MHVARQIALLHVLGELENAIQLIRLPQELSQSRNFLETCQALARPNHVLFGSDWPFAQEAAVAYFTGQLDSYSEADAGLRIAVDRGNAAVLFPDFG